MFSKLAVIRQGTKSVRLFSGAASLEGYGKHLFKGAVAARPGELLPLSRQGQLFPGPEEPLEAGDELARREVAIAVGVEGAVELDAALDVQRVDVRELLEHLQ